MKKNCSCGFIISVADRGWLLCHPTGGGNRWDFPKGRAEPGEDHLVAAIRELQEETGIELDILNGGIIDLGQHPYAKEKDLHLYYIEVSSLNVKDLFCESMVTNTKGPDFPEMDAFAVFPVNRVSTKVSEKMGNWIVSHVPPMLRADY